MSVIFSDNQSSKIPLISFHLFFPKYTKLISNVSMLESFEYGIKCTTELVCQASIDALPFFMDKEMVNMKEPCVFI